MISESIIQYHSKVNESKLIFLTQTHEKSYNLNPLVIQLEANTTLQGRFLGRRKVRNLVRGRKDTSFKMNQHPSHKIHWFQDKSPNRKRPSEHVLRAKLFQLCLTLRDPTDCSPPGSPLHGILRARILEEKYISSSRGSSRPRDQSRISCISCTSR